MKKYLTYKNDRTRIEEVDVVREHASLARFIEEVLSGNECLSVRPT